MECRNSLQMAVSGAVLPDRGRVTRTPDIVLLACQYSVLNHEQTRNHTFPALQKKRSSVVVGTPLNDGFLGGRNRYHLGETIPSGAIEKRVRRAAVADRYGIDIRTAAVQFATAPSIVSAIVPGSRSPNQVRGNVDSMKVAIRPEFWATLQRERLISKAAPLLTTNRAFIMKRNLTTLLLAAAFCLGSLSPLAVQAQQQPAVQASKVRDLAQEEGNRALVIEFYTKVLGEKRLDLAPKYMREDYIQHNPYAATGLAPFLAFFREMFARYPQTEHRTVRSAADGDLVYLHVFVKSGPNDKGRAVVDILRVENGKMAEHWDVVQDIPAQSANSNTMF